MVLRYRLGEELIKKVCRKKGIRILKLPNDTVLNAVVSWIAGQPYIGVLPEKRLVEVALGEEVARLLRMAVELGSLAAALAAGYGSSRVSRMVISASRKAAKRLMGRVPLRGKST